MHKTIAIDLSKHHAHWKAINQISFTRNLVWDPIENTTMFFIIEETKETILDFSRGTVKAF